jgi:chromosome segregation ATPase
LVVELKETRLLQKSYENKCEEQRASLDSVTAEYNELERQRVGAKQKELEREERIETLKKELDLIKEAFDKLEIAHGTLKIEHAKIVELYEASRENLDDTTEKLHLTNKVRHETEVRLGEELENVKNLQEIVHTKQDLLAQK